MTQNIRKIYDNERNLIETTKYYPNGNIEVKTLYENEVPVKMYIWWENKNIAQENTYKNGKLDGAQKYWYLNGNMQSIDGV